MPATRLAEPHGRNRPPTAQPPANTPRATRRPQERKRACEGMRIRRLTGADLRPRHWDAFYAFYLSTVDRRYGQAYLTRDFFARLGETMADRVLLVVAEEEGQGEEWADENRQGGRGWLWMGGAELAG